MTRQDLHRSILVRVCVRYIYHLAALLWAAASCTRWLVPRLSPARPTMTAPAQPSTQPRNEGARRGQSWDPQKEKEKYDCMTTRTD